MDATSSSGLGLRPGEGPPGTRQTSAGQGWDAPGEDDPWGVPAQSAGKAHPGPPRPAPGAASGALAPLPGHAAPRLGLGILGGDTGNPAPLPPGRQRGGDATRGPEGARRAGGRAGREHGSGKGPQAARTYPEVRLEQCARHGRRASPGPRAERSGG